MSKTRICKKCHKTKSIEMFNFKNKWRIHTCKTCQHTKANEYKNNHKLKGIEYKGGKCIDCKNTFPQCVYDFHHLDPKGKDYKPNQLMGYTWDKIKKELDKCVLLCSNCHRIRHSSNK